MTRSEGIENMAVSILRPKDLGGTEIKSALTLSSEDVTKVIVVTINHSIAEPKPLPTHAAFWQLPLP